MKNDLDPKPKLYSKLYDTLELKKRVVHVLIVNKHVKEGRLLEKQIMHLNDRDAIIQAARAIGVMVW